MHMATYYVKNPRSGVSREPEENWLVWFSGSTIEGCNNALLLYGGEVLLLKTAKRIKQDELDALNFENWTDEDHNRWEELFGEGSAADELRAAVREFRKLNR